MSLHRRRFLGLSVGGAAAAALASLPRRAAAGSLSHLGLDAAHLGVRAGSPDDQSQALQAAIDRAAGARVCAVTWGAQSREALLETEPHWCIDRWDELLALLERL